MSFSLVIAQQKEAPNNTHEAVPQKYVLTPDDDAKRKSVAPKTYKTIQNQEEEFSMSSKEIEDRALAHLNTATVPADFPRYNPSVMNAGTYESKVAEFFRNNPEKRKRN
jgi:hypothetical protein